LKSPVVVIPLSKNIAYDPLIIIALADPQIITKIPEKDAHKTILTQRLQ
jgi:hypothetical protein